MSGYGRIAWGIIRPDRDKSRRSVYSGVCPDTFLADRSSIQIRASATTEMDELAV